MDKKMDFYSFDCGCRFEVLGQSPYGGSLPALKLDLENRPLDCPETWSLLGKGLTHHIFQLERGAGKKWTKEMKPENITQLAGLAAVIRPGSADIILEDGKSVTEHFCKRKNGLEPIEIFHESIKDILEPTYGFMINQEQAMLIVQRVANFSLQEADTLRKICGKKDAAGMARMKKPFLEKAHEAGILTDQEAEKLFGWIEKSQKYSFNLCLSPSTLVETQTGFKTLDELQVGELIIGPDGWTEVVNKYEKGEQEVWKLNLYGSSDVIRCTIYHKFLFDNGQILSLKNFFDDAWKSVDDHIYDGIPLIVCRDGNKRICSAEKIGLERTVDIEVKSDRHLFWGNGIATSNSHGVAYSIESYDCAYTKAHFPLQFFCSNLRYCENQDEIRESINDTKRMNVEVFPPDIRDKKKHFYLKGDSIFFGLTDIRDIGEAQANKLLEEIHLQENSYGGIETWNWYETLVRLSNVPQGVLSALIQSGGLRHLKVPRKVMLKELELFQFPKPLSEKEIEFAVQHHQEYDNLTDLLRATSRVKKEGGAAHTAKRSEAILSVIKMLENPSTELVDYPYEIAISEGHYLGTPLTCSRVDGAPGDRADTTCKQFLDNQYAPIFTMKVLVEDVRVTSIKRGKEENIGKEMAILRVSDNTGVADGIPCFTDQWVGAAPTEEREGKPGYRDLLTVGRVLEIQFEKNYKKEGVHVRQVWDQ